MDETPVETCLIENNAGNPERSDEDEDLDKDVAYQSLSESDSDDEFKKITNFSSETALDILYNQLSYTKIFLDYDLQKELCLEIGVHVTTEHPWKTIRKELLEEFLTDSTVETENLRAKLSLIDDNDSVLLVGYHCPDEDTVEDGVFIVYDEIESILIATELIKKLEIWKRFKIKRALNKKPSRSILPSSPYLLKKSPQRRPRISVEIQTSHTTVQKNTKLSFRTCTDVRDGFMELLPSKSDNFENVYRRRIDQGIQSAAQRIDCAQQTDPTFPTNAHTQYCYEILGEGNDKEDSKDNKTSEVVELEEVHPEKLDHENSDEEETVLSVGNTVTQKPPIVVSRQIKELLRTLEFNQIDMYRIEYESIGQRKIPKFRVPYLEEVLCFAEIGKTADRHISCIEWHPKYSGLFIAAYTWDTLSTFIPSQSDKKVDPINKIILQPNYLFMWSFEDALSPLLSFESPREVATVSFHPLDSNILIGGLVNGQVIIWDLTDVLEGIQGDAENDTTPHQEDMRKFLNWTKHSFSKDVVKRSAVSCLEFSQTDRITDIKWLNSNIYLTSSGEIKETSVDSKHQEHRYFVTSSLDGTVAFYNLSDGSIPEEKTVRVEEKKRGKSMKKKTPVPQQDQIKSKYAHFDRKFRPQFVVVLQEPITSFGINAARFVFEPLVAQKRKSFDLSMRMEFKAQEIPYALEREFTLEDEEEGAFNNNIIVTTVSGDVQMVKWKAMESDPAVNTNRQDKLILKSFPRIHDGPVVAMHKNPAMPLLILTIGQTTVSIWRSDFIHSAIYWQIRDVELTDCKWSHIRPSVFFLTRVDGCVEIWDLLSSTQDPCLVETISGLCLTRVSQHLLPISADILAIGDYNSNTRIFKIPKTFSEYTKDDHTRFVDQINKEVERKEKLMNWQDQWKEDNQEILMVKKELSEQERVPSTVKQLLQSDDHSRKKKAIKKDEKSMIEKSELKLEQMNMKRLMQIMMKIKDIDPKECNQKTLPIREQRAYNNLKKTAIKREFSKIGNDLSEMRSKILPVKEDIKDRKDIVRGLVMETILTEEFNQDEFDKQRELKLKGLAKDRPVLSLTEIKERGRHIREILNKSSKGGYFNQE